jgi:hypothetical protein
MGVTVVKIEDFYKYLSIQEFHKPFCPDLAPLCQEPGRMYGPLGPTSPREQFYI